MINAIQTRYENKQQPIQRQTSNHHIEKSTYCMSFYVILETKTLSTQAGIPMIKCWGGNNIVILQQNMERHTWKSIFALAPKNGFGSLMGTEVCSPLPDGSASWPLGYRCLPRCWAAHCHWGQHNRWRERRCHVWVDEWMSWSLRFSVLSSSGTVGTRMQTVGLCL